MKTCLPSRKRLCAFGFAGKTLNWLHEYMQEIKLRKQMCELGKSK
jgi:hypothetical protein